MIGPEGEEELMNQIFSAGSMILTLVWFFCVGVAVVFLVMSIVRFARSWKERRPNAVSDWVVDVRFPAGALILLGLSRLMMNALI